MDRQHIEYSFISKGFLLLTFLMGLVYIAWWFDISHAGSTWLYGALFFGEVYHIIMALTFWLTIWPKERNVQKSERIDSSPSVAVFVPVVSEPIEVVERTVVSAQNMHYSNIHIYILNDAYVAGQSNWQEYERLAEHLGVTCITRHQAGGAKAGNVNNALRMIQEEFIALFDADMQPQHEFLERTMPYFMDEKMAFVQTPQYYSNHDFNDVTRGAWEQQNFFFGPILLGKNNFNAAFICGTNVLLRKKALLEVGGMCEDNIAEDFLTSLFLHQKGWKSMYIPEVLATGFAPFDMGAYYKQQLRWARGSLEVLFGHNPLLKRGLTLSQRIHYFSSGLYYFNGLIVLIDMLIPIIFLLFGLQPVSVSTTSFALVFVPYMFLSLYVIYIVSGRSITFRAFSFSQSSFYLQLMALWSLLTHQKMNFVVTAKEQQEGNYLSLCIPHITYVLVAIFAIGFAVNRFGITPSVIANAAWVIFNIIIFLPFIAAAGGWRPEQERTTRLRTAIT